MEHISTLRGAAGYIVPLEEIRPYGGLPGQELIRQIAGRYEFAVLPNLAAFGSPDGPKGIEFQLGRYQIDGQQINVQRLSIFTDGVVADCLDTRHAAAVIGDLMVWAKEAFSLRDPATPPYWWYASQIVVKFNKSIDSQLALCGRFGEKLSTVFSDLYGITGPYSTSRFVMAIDPTNMPVARRHTEFSIERRIDRPFSENRYFSSAALHTDLHLEMLAEIENSLT